MSRRCYYIYVVMFYEVFLVTSNAQPAGAYNGPLQYAKLDNIRGKTGPSVVTALQRDVSNQTLRYLEDRQLTVPLPSGPQKWHIVRTGVESSINQVLERLTKSKERGPDIQMTLDSQVPS
ncbi:hypothetical protein OBBRIDRAFT_807176 [Obba rivulosa]|uniref:Uncharacterized protein n=1 Tax=Obba rivulosa TaxID=1052685 RepID=A0A8E2AJY6_9APHY|nr:hypothetical protein OBBRIDRAFT_807176 [Obba rivulosa]